MLKQLADETFVISLLDRIDRRKRVESLLLKEGIAFRFVDGVRVLPEELTQNEIAEVKPEEYKMTRGMQSYLMGAIGCKRAHINCLKHGIEAGLKTLLILEDDVGFVEGWHITYLEACKDLPKNWLQLYFSAILQGPTLRLSANLHRVSAAWQTTAILYSQDGMEAALNCLNHARAETDVWFAEHLHPFGCSYAIHPQLTFQIGGFSDIHGHVRERNP